MLFPATWQLLGNWAQHCTESHQPGKRSKWKLWYTASAEYMLLLPCCKVKKKIPKLAALFTYTIEWFLTRQTIIFQLHFIKAELYQRQQQHLKWFGCHWLPPSALLIKIRIQPPPRGCWWTCCGCIARFLLLYWGIRSYLREDPVFPGLPRNSVWDGLGDYFLSNDWNERQDWFDLVWFAQTWKAIQHHFEQQMCIQHPSGTQHVDAERNKTGPTLSENSIGTGWLDSSHGSPSKE